MTDGGNEPITPAVDPGTSAPASDPGTPNGGSGTPPSNAPNNQPNQRDEELKILKKNVQDLNKALIDAKRANRQKSSPMGGEGEGNPFETEAGQYAASLELSDARLRGGLEQRIALYPELSGAELQRIRLNPWAFASRQSFLTGDWETALDEVEEAIANRVEELAGNPSQPSPQPASVPAPATVNPNPAPEGAAVDVEPGTAEDENLWTMPLGKLERLKNKAVAKMSQPQQ